MSWFENTHVDDAPPRPKRQVLGDDLGERRRVPRRESRSKLNACPRPSGRANATRRWAATQASATAIRGGSYSSNRARQVRVDLVDLVAALERVLSVREPGLIRSCVGRSAPPDRRVLDEQVGHVDPEAVDATVRPEPQRREEVLPDLVNAPVEVRLLRGEEVEVPVAVADRLPRGAAEERPPVGRRLRPVGTVAAPDHVAVPCGGSGRRRQRLRNQACRFDVWFGTMSTMSLIPAPWRAATSSSKSSSVPSSGATAR